MGTALTLTLDKNILDKMKEYAESRDTTLSKIVETYFKALIEPNNKEDIKYSPLVEELSGIIQLDNDCESRMRWNLSNFEFPIMGLQQDDI